MYPWGISWGMGDGRSMQADRFWYVRTHEVDAASPSVTRPKKWRAGGGDGDEWSQAESMTLSSPNLVPSTSRYP